jgi:hypothetical protein
LDILFIFAKDLLFEATASHAPICKLGESLIGWVKTVEDFIYGPRKGGAAI